MTTQSALLKAREALHSLAEEFVRVYPLYYYAEPWAHDKNAALKSARATIADLDRAIAEDGWRPIETAPKCETGYGRKRPQYVLVSHATIGWVFVGYRHEPNYPGDPEWCDEHGEFIEPQPTHWKPLPAPPIATENASQEVGK